MKSKRTILILALILFLSAAACADVGPSPSYSFSVINTSDYPDYAFYYAGQLWPKELTHFEEGDSVYKFNTYITIYAIPRGDLPEDQQYIDESQFDSVTANAVKSQEVSLQAGHTTFEIQSFDAASKTMHMQQTGNIPDIGFAIGSIIFLLMMLLPILIIVAIPVIIIAAVIIVVLLWHKKKSAKK